MQRTIESREHVDAAELRDDLDYGDEYDEDRANQNEYEAAVAMVD